jgi:hypothetical protein
MPSRLRSQPLLARRPQGSGIGTARAAHCRSPDLRLVSRDNPLWGAPRHDGEHRQDKNCAHWTFVEFATLQHSQRIGVL